MLRLLPLSLPSASAYPFSALLTNNFSKSVPPRCGPFHLSLFSSRNATFLPHFRGNYRYIGVRSLSLALPILVWKHYGEIHPVPERPLCPFKVFYHPAGQTLSNVEMTFFTIISPRPFLYKAGHLCVLTLCKTRCSFGTTLCCEPLAIATFPAGLPPSQHRAYLA